MLNKLKPYWVIITHDDQSDDDGVPTTIADYAWTRKGGERIAKAVRKNAGPGKWIVVFPSAWHLWWNLNCGTVYRHTRYDEETATFKSKRISWWRSERLPRTLWRLVRGKRKVGAHRASKSAD